LLVLKDGRLAGGGGGGGGGGAGVYEAGRQMFIAA
jgi:hypothetical protein